MTSGKLKDIKVLHVASETGGRPGVEFWLTEAQALTRSVEPLHGALPFGPLRNVAMGDIVEFSAALRQKRYALD